VVPDKKYSMSHGLEGKTKDLTFEGVCENEEFKKEVLADLQKEGKEGALNSLEIVKKILLSHEEMTVENNLLTPTMKIKRFKVVEAYKKQIDAIYTQE